jgi:inorganic pyrophosphatase
MSHFFKVYKQLENRETDVDDLRGPDEARRIINECIERYNTLFT